MITEELYQIARLALEGKGSDVRLYLAKLVRKARKENPEFAVRLEELLKTDPTRADRVMRKSFSSADQSPELKDVSLLRVVDLSSVEEPLLDASLKKPIEQLLLERECTDELMIKGLKPTSSVIFQGPPGVGKTITAKWIAAKLNLPIYILDLTAVMSSLLGKTGNNLREVFEYAKQHPCVLFLDEIDAIAKRRSDEADVGEIKRLVNIMLQELEDWPSSGVLVAATNHPELVDPALWRRFDMEVTFPVPSDENVCKAVSLFLGDDEPVFAPFLNLLIESQRGESYSNIKRLVSRLRRLRIVAPDSFEENVIKHLFADQIDLPRSERINLAVNLVSNFSFPKQKAAKLLGVSRDTIRKRMKEQN